MITSRVFGTITGSNIIIHSSLRRVRILGVEREGIGLKIIDATSAPVGNEVSYIGTGRLNFDSNNPFNSSGGSYEKVYVLYET